MTAKSSRRVVIINNIKSEKIEQAIFILRGSNIQRPDRGVIKEAQDIIDEYIKRVEGDKINPPPVIGNYKSKRNRFKAGLITIMTSAFLLGVIFLVRHLANQ